MSSPETTRGIVLSPRARQDFIDILRFTGETWGKQQLHIYRDKLDAALQRLGRNPGLGSPSPALPPTHRLYYVGAHVIVYRERGADIAVVRILHQRMSRARHV